MTRLEANQTTTHAPAQRRRVAATGSRGYTDLAMSTVLGVIQVIISVVLIFLVLLHSGKDTGLSGAFGIGQSGSSFGGGSLVERNLDRWTVFFAILFVLNTLVLLKI
jgi:preprotein translocase subunit SecG